MGRDQVAIVTGVSSGIGAVVTKTLLSRDWIVIGVSRRPVSFGDDFLHIQLDLGDLDALTAAFEARVAPMLREKAWQRIGLVNNAASPALLSPIEAIGPA